VIGEETLSKTSIFSLRQSAARFANTISFIFHSSLMGNIGSHVNITSGWQRHQAKRSSNMHLLFKRAQAGRSCATRRMSTVAKIDIRIRTVRLGLPTVTT
jgi:hypothetical protein